MRRIGDRDALAVVLEVALIRVSQERRIGHGQKEGTRPVRLSGAVAELDVAAVVDEGEGLLSGRARIVVVSGRERRPHVHLLRQAALESERSVGPDVVARDLPGGLQRRGSEIEGRARPAVEDVVELGRDREAIEGLGRSVVELPVQIAQPDVRVRAGRDAAVHADIEPALVDRLRIRLPRALVDDAVLVQVGHVLSEGPAGGLIAVVELRPVLDRPSEKRSAVEAHGRELAVDAEIQRVDRVIVVVEDPTALVVDPSHRARRSRGLRLVEGHRVAVDAPGEAP